MKNRYYPVFLDLRGRRCVVIGGGEVGERKIDNLLDAEARVVCIAPRVRDAVRGWAEDGRIEWLRREYQPGDLAGARLVVAATDDRAVNQRIAEEAEREKALLNVVDKAEFCNFIAPAIVRRDPVVFAMSTAGGSPALARKLKALGESACEEGCLVRWAASAEVLAKARADVRHRRLPLTPEQWQACLDEELLELIEAGKSVEALKLLIQRLENQAGTAPAP